MPIWFEDKVTDKIGRFKGLLKTNIHYPQSHVLWKKEFENCKYILRKLQFHAGPKYMENPVDCHFIGKFLRFYQYMIQEITSKVSLITFLVDKFVDFHVYY